MEDRSIELTVFWTNVICDLDSQGGDGGTLERHTDPKDTVRIIDELIRLGLLNGKRVNLPS